MGGELLKMIDDAVFWGIVCIFLMIGAVLYAAKNDDDWKDM